jgi:hypothetical protein
MAFQVNEQSTALLSGIFTDEAGAVVGSGEMDTIKATLYNRSNEQIINSRNEQDILNANGGTLDVSGNFTFTFDPADGEIINTEEPYEVHILLLEWTFASGTKGGNQQVELTVMNLPYVS